MSIENVIDIFREALFITSAMVMVIILPSLLVGLVVATFQAATQINEQTLSFLPRLIAVLLTLGIAGSWLGRMVLEFTEKLIVQLPFIIG